MAHVIPGPYATSYWQEQERQKQEQAEQVRKQAELEKELADLKAKVDKNHP